MKKLSINSSTTVSSKSIKIVGTEQKSSMNEQNKKDKKTILFRSFRKSNIKNVNPDSSDFSYEKSSTINEYTSNKDEYIISTEKKDFNIIQRDKNYYSKEKHKKISRLPYNFKNNEMLKVKFLNNNMKSQKLPKYSSDYIKDKLKKDLVLPNVNIMTKKRKKNDFRCRKLSFILSSGKKFRQKYIFLNNKNEYISFGLFYDKDVIDKNKELDDELIENSSDLDVESEEENKLAGINVCMLDLKYAFLKVNENTEYISYVKKNKVKILNFN